MSTAQTPGSPALSFPRRAVGVFVSPATVFDDLRDRPSWIAPLLVIMGLSLILGLLVPADVVREFMEQQMTRGNREMRPEQLEQALKFAKYWWYLGSLVGPAVGILVTSGVLFLVFTLFAGGGARFVHYLSLTSHAFLVQALGGVLTIGIAVAQRDLEMRLSFALLAPGLESGFVYHLLNAITIFGLWTSVVLGIGASRVTKGIGTGTAVGLLLGLYGVFALGSAAFQSLGSSS